MPELEKLLRFSPKEKEIMSKHKVKIVATTAEEFASIEEKLSQLPETIYEQIEEAKNHVGLECLIRDMYQDDKKLFVPSNATQQSILDGQVHIYCGGRGDTEYRFVLNKRMSEKPRAYQYIDMPAKTEE